MHNLYNGKYNFLGSTKIFIKENRTRMNESTAFEGIKRVLTMHVILGMVQCTLKKQNKVDQYILLYRQTISYFLILV